MSFENFTWVALILGSALSGLCVEANKPSVNLGEFSVVREYLIGQEPRAELLMALLLPSSVVLLRCHCFSDWNWVVFLLLLYFLRRSPLQYPYSIDPHLPHAFLQTFVADHPVLKLYSWQKLNTWAQKFSLLHDWLAHEAWHKLRAQPLSWLCKRTKHHFSLENCLIKSTI